MISITRNDLNQAIAEATERAHGDSKQLDRITKAAVWLSKWGGESWVLKSDTITIRSSQFDTNGEVYTLTLGDGFMEHSCKSRRPCWHQILGSLLLAANELREDREALEYGVWYADQDCCGGQGCSLCMVTVEPAFTATYHAEVLRNRINAMTVRPQLAAAIITNECEDEVLAW